ncbi:MAG TPA: PfkB family carbohydrate kinase [Bryobacteraceae bacterium]|jgi:fructokinase|nr:PfkB family carbohydrate kinase [Bryobacteraceae bacterium]
MHLITAGEILWDLIGDAEYLGGAVFNFSAQLTRLGHCVSFVSAVGDDERGLRALAQANALGLSTRFVHTVKDHPTGIVTVTVDEGGQPTYVIHRPAAYDFATLDDGDFRALATPPPDWVAFGTLNSMHAGARHLLRTIVDRFPRARRFYDINLRRDSYTAELVASLCELAQAVKLNEDEVGMLGGMLGTAGETLESFCRGYAARFGWQAVCVTRGSEGCALLLGEEYVELAGYRVAVADTVGAGDAFAAALVHGIHAGWPAREVGDFANRLGALVAGRRGGVPPWTLKELEALQ